MIHTIQLTETFEKWLVKLKDKKVKDRLLARLAIVENGNFGDHKTISANLYELRMTLVAA